LRAEQVMQTRATLVGSARRLFGRDGFAATSVEDIAREARVTTGALYHHFSTKAALFEAVFEQVHEDMLAASVQAAAPARGPVDALALGFDAFLETVLDPEVQRILIIDAPAVMGLARFTEMDERYALAAIVAALQEAEAGGAVEVGDVETLARLLMGALTRGAMLIANSTSPRQTTDAVAAGMRRLLGGLAGGGG
jgi:AcrR family transcriptional regulator